MPRFSNLIFVFGAVTLAGAVVWYAYTTDSAATVVTESLPLRIDEYGVSTAVETDAIVSAPPRSVGVEKPRDRSEILSLLRNGRPDRWSVAWRDYFAGMPPVDLWNLLNDPEIVDQPEAKAVREQIARSCLFGLVREQQHKDGQDLLTTWCAPFVEFGGHDFMRKHMNALADDEALRAAPFNVLYLKNFRGTRQEREQEQAFLETSFKQASDPWSIRASTFSLFAYRSPLVSDDWSEFEMLSRFQRYRLGQIVSVQAACREIRDCGARSVWTAELCATVQGLVCRDGEDLRQIIVRNVSPIELTLIDRIGASVSLTRSSR